MEDDDTPVEIDQVINDLYKHLVDRYGWSLRDIDETNLETLFDFLLMKREDPNTRVIRGKVYKRAERGKPPAWL